METRIYPRATAPHIPTLGDSIRTELAKANAGSFFVFFNEGKVYIFQGSFTNVSNTVIQNAVNAAPNATDKLDAKNEIDNWPLPLKALIRLIVIEFNRLRQSPTTTFPAFTEAQVLNALKAEIDGL